MQSTNRIDEAVSDAIDLAIKDIEKIHPEFAAKFKRRVELKILGAFRESDLIDLVDDVPLLDEDGYLES